MRFEPGRVVLRRSWRGGRISFVQATVVVDDGGHGLLVWLPVGAAWGRIRAADGRDHHDAPIDLLGVDATLGPQTWQDRNVLIWMPGDRPHSVWWFWDAHTGEFEGWKGDLQDQPVRWDDGHAAGVDTADHALDVMVAPDRTWRWKDEEEFASRTGHPLYWSASEADAIRAEGERLAKLAEAEAFPFDGSWLDFHPDPAWQVPTRFPSGWNRPRTV
jgi:hypothetical protein